MYVLIVYVLKAHTLPCSYLHYKKINITRILAGSTKLSWLFFLEKNLQKICNCPVFFVYCTCTKIIKHEGKDKPR